MKAECRGGDWWVGEKQDQFRVGTKKGLSAKKPGGSQYECLLTAVSSVPVTEPKT